MKRNYDDPQYEKARKAAARRDRYKCIICGSRRKLRWHHLNGWHWFIAGRYEVSNLVTICDQHHEEFHFLFGKKDNTIYQFEQFLNQYYHTTLSDLMNKKKKK